MSVEKVSPSPSSPPPVRYASLPAQGVEDSSSADNSSGASGYVFAQYSPPPGPSGGQASKLFKTKVDPKKAEKFKQEGDHFIEKQDYQKAAIAYMKAVQADPTNIDNLFAFAQAAHAAGALMEAHDAYSVLIEKKPSAIQVRALRAKLDEQLLEMVPQMVEKAEGDQKEKLKQLISMIAVEMRVDQAIVLANNADNEIKGLKAAEAKLGELHSLPPERKKEAKEVLEQILGRGQETLALANLPFPNPKDRMFVAQQLTKIASEAFGLLARFAAADSDAAIKRLAPFYEAYQALAQHSQIQAERDQLVLEKRELDGERAQLEKDSKSEDAKKKKEEADKKSVEAGKKAAEAEEKMAAVAKAFSTLREEGYKTYGDGDAAKGKKKLEDVMTQAQQLLKDKKIAEAQKLLVQIPQGLLDAHEFLAQYEGDKLKEANLLALDIWDKQQKAYWSKSVDNETNFGWVFYGFALGRAVRAIRGKPMIFDEINMKAEEDHALIAALRLRIEKGDSKTIQEALDYIRDQGPDELKGRAGQILAVGDNTDEKLDFPVGQMVAYVSKYPLDSSKEKFLLAAAEVFSSGPFTKSTATSLYQLLKVSAQDPDTKKRAREGYEKMVPSEKTAALDSDLPTQVAKK